MDERKAKHTALMFAVDILSIEHGGAQLAEYVRDGVSEATEEDIGAVRTALVDITLALRAQARKLLEEEEEE